MPETEERGHVDKAKNGKKAGMRAAERGTYHRCDARSEMRARVVLRGIFDPLKQAGTSIPLKTTGRIPFTLDSIPYSASFAVQDMTSLRRATGKNVRGLIGSDVLGFYRLTVDFKT